MRFFFLIAALLAISTFVLAEPITINFDGLKDGTKVTTQFNGVAFTNATVLTAGVTLNELEFPPKSGTNVVFNDGGAMTITFTLPITDFAANFTYDSRITLTAFDTNGNKVSSLSSLFINNLALSGVAGSKPNELLSLSSALGISKIVISSTGSFVLDDLKYNSQAASVPEPATLALTLGGMVTILATRRSKRSV